MLIQSGTCQTWAQKHTLTSTHRAGVAATDRSPGLLVGQHSLSGELQRSEKELFQKWYVCQGRWLNGYRYKLRLIILYSPHTYVL